MASTQTPTLRSSKMEEKQKTRGGRRAGAGRPANDRSISLTVRITQEAMDKLNRMTSNKSEFIDRLIKEF